MGRDHGREVVAHCHRCARAFPSGGRPAVLAARNEARRPSTIVAGIGPRRPPCAMRGPWGRGSLRRPDHPAAPLTCASVGDCSSSSHLGRAQAGRGKETQSQRKRDTSSPRWIPPAPGFLIACSDSSHLPCARTCACPSHCATPKAGPNACRASQERARDLPPVLPEVVLALRTTRDALANAYATKVLMRPHDHGST